ncbi:amino acid adenylation domain-containing protein [Pseudorhizobium tarimense]|uniref:Amino acid adenylation domain-containing protein n=1 Tax=Pseudorhizobium tarimense TaxID=1079109 RepID=A0ABV2H4G8_9HYPH|nr:non-ribosomal peptide synthetase/type I polyketide synthase [Pseudorhizobium tarimense]MCJ8518620.1 amino acid adenylation domain-containing protein [Pseudorhizobium tarimense]
MSRDTRPNGLNHEQPSADDADLVEGIAIVGMSGRFPGAPDVDTLWELVTRGGSAFRKFDTDEIEDAFTDEERASPDYVPCRPHLDGIDLFDAEFFGMFAREAALTDPQHRLFLEICWEALEMAGYDPYHCPGAVGVFAGSAMPTYLLNNVLSDRAVVEELTSNYQIGFYNQVLGSISDALATRIAYKFNLRGPAFTLQSACSTSLLAVSQACQNLLTYSCDMALAGGVSITVPQKRGYIYQEGGMVSRDGICRPFDADASGTVFGSGAGVVLLKRLEDAIADGDLVYAVIRGYGVNNDGSDKIGFAAPSAEGQADVISAAIAHAGIDPSSIGYVECHGTATPLGDPIEFSGLKQAFSGAHHERNACALGSLKGTVGHLDAAAGVAGLIKATLALHHRKIPVMPNFNTSNPRIELGDTRFYIPRQTKEWAASSTPRRAGVSAFGVGGTNIHVVLEEAPRRQERQEKEIAPLILPLSARSEPALVEMRRNLASHLEQNRAVSLSAVARTLQEGRHAFMTRATISATSVDEAINGLRRESLVTAVAEDQPPPVVFMFPGQGSQYVGMGAALYASEPEFARWIDRGTELLKMHFGIDLREYICHAGPASSAMTAEQRETRIAQPCLYLVEYALAQLWLSRGLRPTAMIGHSVGEFVAATLANVISFEDALNLVATRGQLMQEQAPGAMLSVRAAPESLREHLKGGAEIAAINAPKLCVASGPLHEIELLCLTLEQAGIAFSRLHTSHAFHSAMMEPCVEALRDVASKVTYGRATIPYISCVTGDWQTDALGSSPNYWSRHCREPVRFSDGLLTLCREQRPILLEVGPGRTLSVFAAQTVGRDQLPSIVQSLPEHDNAAAARHFVAEAHGRLWMAGSDLPWPDLLHEPRRTVALPTYPFQRQRHWMDAPPSARRAHATQPAQLTDPETIKSERFARSEVETMNAISTITVADRTPELETALITLLSEMSGEPIGAGNINDSFLDLGFDSLFIGQFAQKIDKQYRVKISFRELLANIPSVAALARYLDQTLPPEPAKAAVAVPPRSEEVRENFATPPTPAQTMAPIGASVAAPVLSDAGDVQSTPVGAGLEALLQSQLSLAQSLFTQQFQLLQGGRPAPAALSTAMTHTDATRPVASELVQSALQPSEAPGPTVDSSLIEEIGGERYRHYQQGGAKAKTDLGPEKEAFINDLVLTYSNRNRRSKEYTQAHRAHLADPRTASGFRAEWKEMIFPVVCDRSKGARLWDIDGHEYIDLVNGFGQTAFGHAPDFVVEAMKAQVDDGFAIGPQTPLAGEVAELLAAMTGHERVTFCNTGSEAVMASMRLARAITGRERIVVFANDYHGQFDEVLVKGRARAKEPVALAIAAGIPSASVSNMIVLPYGATESLEWIRANAEDLAAVIIEPIQSRHPELRPRDFVLELRKFADASGYALVFDEVVTGFRVDPGGMQAIWGIKGDMATYGKVVGGGMPIGVLAGSSRFMDALDGGHWCYGDDSVPNVVPTFFAGTFVRHPVVLSAARAVLHHIRGEGAALYDRVARRTEELVEEINSDLAKRGIPPCLRGYKSWFVTDFSSQDPLGGLLYPYLRMNGIHIQDGYPCFLTTAHTEEDFTTIARAFRDAVDALQCVGILAPKAESEIGGIDPAPSQGPKPTLHRYVRAESAQLTEAQSEIWLAAQAGEEASCSFNESLSLLLNGPLDREGFLSAIHAVVARHDALHIRFDRNGECFRFISGFELPVEVVDLTEEADADAILQELIETDAKTPFDLIEGPLARAYLVILGPNRHVLVFTAHHIVCDGWSLNVIINEFAETYSAGLRGEGLSLEPAMSFAEYAEKYAPSAEVSTATAQFWHEQFKELPELPDMPLDRPYPDRRSFAGGTCTVMVSSEIAAAVRKRGARAGATMFSTMLAAVQVMLARLSGQTDMVIAVPSAGQSQLDERVLVGHCVNLLPIRQTVELGASFEDHLQTTQQLILKAFEHQDYTYGTLVKTLGVKRDPRRLPLTGIQFNLERVAANAEFEGLQTEIVPNPKCFANFDMFLNMIESREGIRIDADYNADVLDRETVERWIGHLVTLISALADDISRPLNDLPLLSEAQIKWLADDLNQTATEYPQEAFAFSLITHKSQRRPDAVAARYRGQSITYAELEAQTNRFARHVRNVVPGEGERLALLVDRSLDMLVALIGIMKAGHAYVPLDPTHPETRLRQTLSAARPAALICSSDVTAALATEGMGTIRLDKEASAIAAYSGSNLESLPCDTETTAYVIFTSGSTGTPKGVSISHRSLTNFLLSMAKEPGFAADDVVVAVTTISFDIAGLELYLPLIAGGSVVIADRSEVEDGFALVRLLDESKATVLQATPTLWQMLLEAGLDGTRSLKKLCGGEALPKSLAKTLAAMPGSLWNMYGPTETTIWSSVARIEDGDAPITIGHPIANTQLHILGTDGRLAPPGTTGELCIAGDGLAQGYFARADLTEAAFVLLDIGLGDRQRLYKTGDLGRRMKDGSLQLLGRRDNQVKLRGFRIELGDIEAVISQVEGMRKCAVVGARNGRGDLVLACYFVADAGTSAADPVQLADAVRADLPAYMVPTVWSRETELPLTKNGKLDRKALEDRELRRGDTKTIAPKIAPRTPMEEKLMTIWKGVLDIHPIGVEDNLYSLGADSLTIFRIAARMLDEGLPLEAKHLLRYPSIAELAAYAEDALASASAVGVVYQIPSLSSFRNGARRRMESLS